MWVRFPPRAQQFNNLTIEQFHVVIMKFEFSAGGIVLRKTKNNFEVLVCQHSKHHGWVFPKGLIGDHQEGEGKSASAKGFGETKEAAALREVKEEVGVVGKIIKPLLPVEYWYVFEGTKIRKTVYYFLMEYLSGDIGEHDREMEKVEWLPVSEVEERLSFKGDKKVWEEAKEFLISNF